MKSLTILAVLAGGAALCVLATCGIMSVSDTMDRQRNAAVANHQRDIADAIKAKQVMVGMTAAEVVQAWGKPRKVDRTSTANHEHENWFYGSGSLLIFFDGKVRSITTSPAR